MTDTSFCIGLFYYIGECMDYIVKLNGIEIKVSKGENLLRVLQSKGFFIDVPCGGVGTCGKCKVELDGEIVLACNVTVDRDMEVEISDKNSSFDILTWGNIANINVEDREYTEGYAVVVDIGTTTVVLYLIDFATASIISTHSYMNPQKAYGADVISRINYTINNENGTETLRNSIVSSINRGVDTFDVEKSKIRSISLVGNTTMLHFLLGYETAQMAVIPFTPITVDYQEFVAKDIGIKICDNTKAYILPCVSAYVGADLIAAVVSTDMENQLDGYSMVVDIGTNGEIAVGNMEKIYVASTAAGPAFEGANIECGVGGIEGAIDKVVYNDNGFSYTTIGGKNPVGICGSGIISIISTLIDAEVIDYTGRIQDKDEQVNEDMKDRIIEGDTGNSFMVCDNIAITQKDVRELQNAKAAIAAGIEVMLNKVDLDEVKNLYIAGGFGSKIDINSAFRIKLLPEKLKSKIQIIGNAAGVGGIMTIMSKDKLEAMIDIGKSAENVELSGNSEFSDLYIDNMFF